LGIRALARALGLSVGVVCKYHWAVRVAGSSAAETDALTTTELEQHAFGPGMPNKPKRRVPPECAWIRLGLKRHRHVTLQLLSQQYVQAHVQVSYRRSTVCQIYRCWEKRLKRSGERC
jgi:hypothetical protein